MVKDVEHMKKGVEDMKKGIEDLKKGIEAMQKHLDDREAAYAQHKLYKQILQVSGERFMKKLFKRNGWPESEDGT